MISACYPNDGSLNVHPLILVLGVIFCAGCSTLEEPKFEVLKQISPRGVPYLLLTYPSSAKNPDEIFPLIFASAGGGVKRSTFLEFLRPLALKTRVIVLVAGRKKAYDHDLSDLKDFYELVDEISAQHPVDRERIYMVGASAGAELNQWLVRYDPGRWAGAVFMNGPWETEWLTTEKPDVFPPMLFLHGTRDVPFSSSGIQALVESARTKGMQASLILDDEVGHAHGPDWDHQIFDWLDSD